MAPLKYKTIKGAFATTSYI